MSKYLNDIEFILMDVEGTTSSKDFVLKTLFPYSFDRIESYLNEHAKNPQVEKVTSSISKDIKVVISQMLEWIKQDKKEPALKTLQGLIWEEGYKKGELLGHVYDDVEPALKRWIHEGKKLGIYSSGSVLAQKLIFTYSMAGDLSAYLSAHFDTAVGGKREAASYQKISNELKVPASKILFLSDIEKELEAASAAGFKVLLINRDDSVHSHQYSVEENFNAI